MSQEQSPATSHVSLEAEKLERWKTQFDHRNALFPDEWEALLSLAITGLSVERDLGLERESHEVTKRMLNDASALSDTRPIYAVEQLESWQQSFENLRREFRRQGNHDGQRGCEFALESIRLYQTGTPVSAIRPISEVSIPMADVIKTPCWNCGKTPMDGMS